LSELPDLPTCRKDIDDFFRLKRGMPPTPLNTSEYTDEANQIWLRERNKKIDKFKRKAAKWRKKAHR